MDNWYIIAAIWIIGALISAIRAANKKKAAPPTAQTNQNPASDLPNVFHSPRPNQVPATPKQAPTGTLREEFRKSKAEERESASHYSEERLIREYESQHQQGLPLQHHFHTPLKPLPSVYKDRKKPTLNHPLVKFLQNNENVKMAVIASEVLKRPEF